VALLIRNDLQVRVSLLARQAEIDSLLDLDKGDQQGAAPDPDKDEQDVGRTAPAASHGPAEVAKMAVAYMRASETAIREMPITERMPPQTGQFTGRAVAKDGTHVAFATAANSFFVVGSSSLNHDIQIGARVSLRFHQGRASLDNGRGRGR
jgi:hypothetical protein